MPIDAILGPHRLQGSKPIQWAIRTGVLPSTADIDIPRRLLTDYQQLADAG